MYRQTTTISLLLLRRRPREEKEGKEGDVYYATARVLLMSSHRVFLYKALCVQQLFLLLKNKNNLLLTCILSISIF